MELGITREAIVLGGSVLPNTSKAVNSSGRTFSVFITILFNVCSEVLSASSMRRTDRGLAFSVADSVEKSG